jgi:hypothetical protein
VRNKELRIPVFLVGWSPAIELKVLVFMKIRISPSVIKIRPF